MPQIIALSIFTNQGLQGFKIKALVDYGDFVWFFAELSNVFITNSVVKEVHFLLDFQFIDTHTFLLSSSLCPLCAACTAIKPKSEKCDI